MEIRYSKYFSAFFLISLLFFLGFRKIAKYIYCAFGLKSNNIFKKIVVRCTVLCLEEKIIKIMKINIKWGFPGFWWKHLLFYAKQRILLI